MAASKVKVYVVIRKSDGKQTYVMARTRSTAVSAVAKPDYEAHIATQTEVLKIGRENLEIIDATKDDDEGEAAPTGVAATGAAGSVSVETSAKGNGKGKGKGTQASA